MLGIALSLALPAYADNTTGQTEQKPAGEPSTATTGSVSSAPKESTSGSNNSGSSSETANINSPGHTEPEHHAAEEIKTPPEQHKSTASASHLAPEKPVKLYGRIEELCAATGAKIPLKMKAMVPIRDSSLDDKQSKLAGGATMQDYPIDYRGTWAGELTVYTANFDRSYFQNSPEEAKKEQQLLRPGIKGQYSVTFYQDRNNHIDMQPSQVMFQGTDSMANQMKLMSRNSPGMSGMFGASNPMMGNMQLPIFFALKLGTKIGEGEIGVTGNQISNQLMKNSLRELKKGVLENQIVTKDRDRDPQTGKVQDGFTESVLRFTRISRDQLYLQAASVYYRANGQFQSKFVLYGTLNRSNGTTATTPNPFGAGGNPFGGMMPGMGGGANPLGGGAGNLQQQMQQMQKMIQQMGGQ